MITIDDQLHTFDGAQLQQLHDLANAYQFDVKVLVSDGSLTKPAFESSVASRVTGLRQVSIGVDPKHHFTFVRGSKDLGLPSGPDVASAGNSFFRRGDLVGGIDAIAARANSLKVAGRVVESQTGAPIVVHEHTTSAGVWWLLGGLGALVLAVVAYVIWRSNKRDAEARRLNAELNNEIGTRQLERAERGAEADFDARLRSSSRPAPSGAYGAARPPRPSYSPYSYAVPVPVQSQPPIIVNQGGSRDGLTDLLLLDAVLDHDRRDRVVERERVVERDSSSSSWGGSSNSDDSSSSSSWDSGSSSDSSSSSDWGGSSDGGGSGFDSGGGGDSW